MSEVNDVGIRLPSSATHHDPVGVPTSIPFTTLHQPLYHISGIQFSHFPLKQLYIKESVYLMNA
jgi:hypothetical protein